MNWASGTPETGGLSPSLNDFWRGALQGNRILTFFFSSFVLLNNMRALLMLSFWPPFYLFVMLLLPPLSTAMRALKGFIPSWVY